MKEVQKGLNQICLGQLNDDTSYCDNRRLFAMEMPSFKIVDNAPDELQIALTLQ